MEGSAEGSDERALVAQAEESHEGDDTGDESEDGEMEEIPEKEIVVDIAADEPEVVLAGLRLANIASFGLEKYTAMSTLSLHRNLLHKVERLPENCLTTLTTLDLSDNKIKRIPDHLASLVNLTSLDMSYNNLRTIQNLEGLTGLRSLFLQSNKFQKIENLGALVELRSLELGANRIRVIENLESLVNLEQLFLSKNKIDKIQQLDTLTKLKSLYLQANRIGAIEGLDALTELEELYISENAIGQIANMGSQSKLRVLDLALQHNQISLSQIPVEEMAAFRETLIDFWFNQNKISSWGEVERLKDFPNLECVYLEHNPIFDDLRYRARIVDLLPQIKELDSIPIPQRN